MPRPSPGRPRAKEIMPRPGLGWPREKEIMPRPGPGRRRKRNHAVAQPRPEGRKIMPSSEPRNYPFPHTWTAFLVKSYHFWQPDRLLGMIFIGASWRKKSCHGPGPAGHRAKRIMPRPSPGRPRERKSCRGPAWAGPAKKNHAAARPRPESSPPIKISVS